MSVWSWIKRGFLIFLVLIVVYQLWIFLCICWWEKHNPDSSAFMDDRLAVMQKDDPDATLSHQWTDYAHISNNLKRAVIAAEDAKFVDHEGFDWDGIEKAYEKNLKKGRIVAGGSTISQQLAKNLFLSTKRTPWRKLEEAAITLMLENRLSKRRIFEIYLNSIEWGNGVFGAQAAARHYFKTTAAGLNAGQSAKLAAMIPNPRYYDQHMGARGLAKKTGIILNRMGDSDIP